MIAQTETAPVIRGMAWDHPRAVNPLRAISASWSRKHNASVLWEARPLKDFEDQPLEELAQQYDLVLIDHPFVGVAASSGLIAPVEEWADPAYLADQEKHSVGPSYSSYTWDDKQWALAIDAACQVAACRDDLFRALRLGVLPADWRGVAALAHDLSNETAKVAIPLNPNHAYCAFLSIAVTLGGRNFWPKGRLLPANLSEASLDFLKSISTALHPLSGQCDPIAISDAMSEADEIAYAPLMFGYSNYARNGFRKYRLRFTDAPSGPSGVIGSVLGGVGVSVSAQSKEKELAADLAKLLVSSTIQKTDYVDAGGQPGHDSAWRSPFANGLTRDFFTATRKTIESAFIRPRTPGHRRFQELSGERIHRFIWGKGDTAFQCVRDLNQLVKTLLPDWELDQKAFN